MEITKKELQLFRAITLTNPETVSALAQTTSTSLSYVPPPLKDWRKKASPPSIEKGERRNPGSQTPSTHPR